MASQSDGDFLIQAATYLGAAAVAVPLFNRFKLGSILGYLVAGVLVGPHLLGLIEVREGVFHIAELGVVLFLFIIGLELSLARLWSLRRDIFGLGAAQMAATGVVFGGVFAAFGMMSPPGAIIAGLSLAFSSTAFALQFMKDRGELNTRYGARAFPVLLFQDLAVIPLLAIVPFFAVNGGETIGLEDLAKMAGVIAALMLAGRFLLTPTFRMAANSGSREAFAATALFVVAITAVAVSWAGLSMALGAFLAGALLADSAYRHQIETDIEPFRGLLLGLFFMSIGISLDLSLIADAWAMVIGAALGLMAVKAALIFGLARAFATQQGDAMKVGAVLSQGGEFAFVIFSLGVDGGLFTSAQATLLSAIITVSMALTPGAMALAASLARIGETAQGDDVEGPHEDAGHMIIAGFGRMGQIISQVLQNSGVAVTAIDRDPQHIRNAERFGFKVYYGDASRLDVLLTAGALDARGVILCMDDAAAVSHAVQGLRERAPTLPIFAVAHDRLHEIELQSMQPDVIVRETLESSLLIAREALRHAGFEEKVIEDIVQEFRKRDRQRLLAQVDQGAEAGKDLLHKPFAAFRGDDG